MIRLLFAFYAWAEDIPPPEVPLNEEQIQDIEDQTKGDYPPMNRQIGLLGTTQHAWDEAKEGAGVYEVRWTPHEIIRLRLRENLNTTLLFPEWESIEQVHVADEEAFTHAKMKDNVILVRPQKFVGTDTSLTLMGKSGHVYVFYVRSEAYNSKHISDLMVHIKASSPSSKKQVTKETPETFNPSQLSFKFTMRGDRDIAPERVYSDGIFTWFDFGSSIKTGRLSVVAQVLDSVETPVNVTREGTALVARGKPPFLLRNGQKILCVTPSS